MGRELYLDYIQIEIIADSLADMDDWICDDLCEEFISRLRANEVELRVEQMRRLFDTFCALKNVNHGKVNHREFVESFLSTQS